MAFHLIRGTQSKLWIVEPLVIKATGPWVATVLITDLLLDWEGHANLCFTEHAYTIRCT